MSISQANPSGPRAQLGLLVLVSSGFLLSLDLTMVNVAIGPIKTDLQASMSQLGWLLTSYPIAMMALVLSAAPLGDRVGRKRLFLGGLSLFCAGGLVAGLGSAISLLIAGRVLMGLGAALMQGPAQLLTVMLFPPAQRTAAFATWATANALGLCSGPVLGAVLVSGPGWPWVFLINAPLAALALLVGWRVLPPMATQPSTRLDGVSVASSSLGLALALGGLIEAPVWGWGSPAIAAAIVLGLLLLLLFVRRQPRLAQPLLQPAAWAPPPVRRAVLSLAAMTMSFNGSQFLAVIALHQVGWAPFAIGMLLAPFAVVVWLTTRCTEALQRRFGVQRLISLAHAPLVGGFVAIGLAAGSPQPSWGIGLGIGLGLMLSGLGLGTLGAVAAAAVYNALPEDLASSGTSLVMVSRLLGSSVIVAALSSALASGFSPSAAALLAAAMVTGCWLLPRCR